MGWFDALSKLLTGRQYASLSQQQTEAFIDTLTFVVVVDDTIDTTERDRLDDALDEMDWNGERPLSRYVEGSIERARGLEPAQYNDYLEGVSARLDEQSIREQAYYVGAQIAYADESGIIESERQLLRKLVEAFEIDSDRLSLMTDELRKNM